MCNYLREAYLYGRRPIPQVTGDQLVRLDETGERLPPVPVESADWYAWLNAEDTRSFAVRTPQGTFTARRERQHGSWYWYAYRTRGAKLRKVYLGKSEELTRDRLNEAAASLADHQSTSTEPQSAESSTHLLPLLTTKITPPPVRRTLVARPRLIDRLNAATEHTLTLISAPAGFGKTTLLSEWITRSVRPVAWLSLDAEDNDLVRFFTYFIAALRTLHDAIGDGVLSMLQSPQPLPLAMILPSLINEVATIPTDIVLVLDDYHLIDAQPIHDMLVFLLDHLPPQMHLVIATRSDPPLSLARLRARGQLREVRAADLRFTHDEVVAFLTTVMDLKLSAVDVAALETRVEGWVTGLQLAALAMHGREDISGFLAAFTGSHRYVLTYLVEDVLEHQPEHVQTFLLRTSILDRLTSPLCNALTDGTDSQAMLELLEQANLFTVPLDDEGTWYRYHPLFADTLRHHLQRTQPDLVPELHRRASVWYEQQGFVAEAVRHALSAKDVDRAALLIEHIAKTMLGHGEIITLRGWMEALPAEMVRGRPWLGLTYAWILLINSQLEAIAPRLEDVEQALAAQHELSLIETNHLLGQVAALRAQVALQAHDFPRAIDLCRQALERIPQDNAFGRSIVALSLGSAYRLSGDAEAASKAFSEASANGQAAGHILLTLYALTNLAELSDLQGQLHQVARIHRQALRLATEGHGQPVPIAGMAHVGLGKLLREWNDLDAAMRHLLEGEELGRRGGLEGVVLDSAITQALVFQAQGNAENALERLDSAEEIAQRLQASTIVERIAAFRARLDLARGRLGSAVQWVQQSGLRVDDEMNIEREIEHLTLARVLIAQGREQPTSSHLQQALALLSRLRKSAETAGRLGRVIEIQALQALALHAQGDTAGAMTALERAVSLAEPEGYVRTFVDEDLPMRELLRRLLELQRKSRTSAGRGYSLEYVRNLLVAFEQPIHRLKQTPPARAVQPLLDPLSERELEVLRLIAAGRKNQEIADELVVVVGTVKAHINSIYRKLDVTSRVQAVSRAKALHLL